MFDFTIRYYPTESHNTQFNALFDLLLVTNSAIHDVKQMTALNDDDFLDFFLIFADVNDGTDNVLDRAVEAAPGFSPEERDTIAVGLEEKAATLERFGEQFSLKISAEYSKLAQSLLSLMANSTLEATGAFRV